MIRTPNIVSVHPSVPVKSIAELMGYIKANEGVSYATSGTGQSPHLTAAWFLQLTGLKMTHVPFRGAGPAITAALGGQVPILFDNLFPTLPQVRGGKLRGLGVTSAERSRAAPDIPAIAETLPGYVATSWYGIGVPAGTPEPIVAKLEAAIGQALARPEVIERFTGDLGMDMPPAGRKGLQAFIDADRALWAPAVKASGVRFE